MPDEPPGRATDPASETHAESPEAHAAASSEVPAAEPAGDAAQVASETLSLYRGFVLVLVLAVGALGWAVMNPVPSTQPRAAPVAPATEQPASPGVEALDLVAEASRIELLHTGTASYERHLHAAREGLATLRVLGFGETAPLRLSRRERVVSIVISGQGTVTHFCGDASGVERAVSVGDVVISEPYCARRFRNATRQHMLARLDLTTPGRTTPYPRDDLLVAEEDPRNALGDPPRFLSFAGDAMQPGALVERDMRFVYELLSEAGELPEMSGASIVYVLSGRGTMVTGAEQQLGPGTLVQIPAATRTAWRPEEPLHLLVFRPWQDGVSPLVRSGESRYSQGPEERIARAEFEDARELVFLDVGAAHYERISTTYYLEEQLGWSGVAVDAQREFAAGYREHRLRTRFFAYLVTDESGDPETLFRDARVPAVASTSAAVTRAQVAAVVGEAEIEQIDVPTITLDDLLQREELEHVDFVSMDIEEHEPEALRGFDLDRYAPRLVLVEAHGRVQDQLYEYFVTRGYRRLDRYLAYDATNWYFAPDPG